MVSLLCYLLCMYVFYVLINKGTMKRTSHARKKVNLLKRFEYDSITYRANKQVIHFFTFKSFRCKLGSKFAENFDSFKMKRL